MAKAKEVAEYYNEFTTGYLKTYGDTIQAFRPTNTADLHEYVAKSVGFEDGMDVLDAGCGVCGPSVYFALRNNIRTDAITISDYQIEMGTKNVTIAGVGDRVKIHKGDYHDLAEKFEGKQYDRIIFLESLGHAHTPDKVIENACSLLKDEGCIYLKDFFPFDIDDAELRTKHQRVVDNINKWYEYNTLNLHETVKSFRRRGMEVVYIRKMKFADDIQARFDFEEMHKVDLFEEMEEFRVAEWLELMFRKPSYPLF